MATLARYNQLPTFFNPFYSRPVIHRQYNTAPVVPAVNVKETETAFIIELAAPGLKKEDLKIQVEKNTLTIGYQSEQKNEETADRFTRQEFSLNSFERSFRLPKNVNTDEIKAAYTDGILTVELPKVEAKEENSVKEITVA